MKTLSITCLFTCIISLLGCLDNTGPEPTVITEPLATLLPPSSFANLRFYKKIADRTSPLLTIEPIVDERIGSSLQEMMMNQQNMN